MTSSLTTKGEVLVFGGTGSIGSATVDELLREGHNVVTISSGKTPFRTRVSHIADAKASDATLRHISCNVTDFMAVTRLSQNFPTNDPNKTKETRVINGIIYAVGHCPPGGFDAEVRTPLAELHCCRLRQTLDQHVVGLHNVVAAFRYKIRPSGWIVVIGSAITRLLDPSNKDRQSPPPSWLHAGHHAAAIAGQRELVRWVQREPYFLEHGILVHYLALGAVDTPFHQDCQHQLPHKLPVDFVTQYVMGAMRSTESDETTLLSLPESV